MKVRGSNSPEQLKTKSMPVYLDKEYREWLFSICYHACGSLGEIGRGMGYQGRPGINGPVRDMWLGSVAIPGKRIAALAALVPVSVEEVLAHSVPKERNELTEDWRASYEKYARKL